MNPLRVAIALQDENRIRPSNAMGIQTIGIVGGLKKLGHHVSVFYPGSDRRIIKLNPFSREEKEIQRGVSNGKAFKQVESGLRRIQSQFELPYLALFDNFRSYEALKEAFHDFDVIHLRDGFLSIAASLAAVRSGISVVVFSDAPTIEEMEFMKLKVRGVQRFAARRMERYSLSLAARVICVSEPAKQLIIQKWNVDPEKVVVLANAVDCEKFKPQSASKSVLKEIRAEGCSIIMFVGSFMPWHDVGALVEAFKGIADRFPDTLLCLVGNGPNRREIEGSVSNSGLRSRVRFMGEYDHSRMPEVLSIADVLVAPYPRIEDFWWSPIKIFEYMAMGKPIVATNVGDIPRYVPDGKRGLLSRPGSAADMKKKLSTVLEVKSLARELGANARKAAESDYSMDRYAERLEAVYAESISSFGS